MDAVDFGIEAFLSVTLSKAIVSPSFLVSLMIQDHHLDGSLVQERESRSNLFTFSIPSLIALSASSRSFLAFFCADVSPIGGFVSFASKALIFFSSLITAPASCHAVVDRKSVV